MLKTCEENDEISWRWSCGVSHERFLTLRKVMKHLKDEVVENVRNNGEKLKIRSCSGCKKQNFRERNS